MCDRGSGTPFYTYPVHPSMVAIMPPITGNIYHKAPQWGWWCVRFCLWFLNLVSRLMLYFKFYMPLCVKLIRVITVSDNLIIFAVAIMISIGFRCMVVCNFTIWQARDSSVWITRHLHVFSLTRFTHNTHIKMAQSLSILSYYYRLSIHCGHL